MWIMRFITGGGYLVYRKFGQAFANWNANVERTYEVGKPTHMITLKADIGFGNCPYILYTGNNGISFTIEKANLKEGTIDEWLAPVRSEQGLQYKFFIGPAEHFDIGNPFRNARWQKTHDGKNVVVSPEDLTRGELDENQLRRLPDCTHPAFEK
jgi:hypothetical protein